jgi:hypothetical protein
VATHHRIIIRHMHDGIFRAGCMNSDIGDVSANKAEDCERRAIETMIGYGDFDLGEDTYEIEFVDSAGNSSVHQRASLIPPQGATITFKEIDHLDTPDSAEEWREWTVERHPTFVYVHERHVYGPRMDVMDISDDRWFPGVVTLVAEQFGKDGLFATVACVDPAPMAQPFKVEVPLRHVVDAQTWVEAEFIRDGAQAYDLCGDEVMSVKICGKTRFLRVALTDGRGDWNDTAVMYR